MARIRYVGEHKDGKYVPMSGGAVLCPRMKWVDLVAEAEKAYIRVEHAEIATRSLAALPDWESEPHKKAAKTRAENAAEKNDDKHDDKSKPDEENDQ